MPVLFSNMETKNSSTLTSTLPEPVRGSLFLLLSRIFLVMTGTDIIYLSVRIFVFELNPQWINGITLDIIFFIFLIFSYIVQIFLIYTVLLHWLNKRYYLESNHLIIKRGIFTIVERIYNLEDLRSVVVTQGIIGKIFHFGTITLEITSPGLNEQAILTEIPHPHKLEKQIKKFM
jgi:uncharacterized membrane protein YdbT with pleckstrin-like domain